MPLRHPRRAGVLLATGQTTQYNSELDDGNYEYGLTKRYEVLSAGQYSGTSNIDLIHLTAATISFAATTPGTIADSGNGLAIFKTGDVIVVTGSASNDGTYNISTGNVAATIRTTEATLLEAAGATVSIAKREALSNNCVQDLVTGLMWARYGSAENAAMGSTSTGAMPWTGQLFDVFQWCAAANAASLGGYADWRIPNVNELFSIVNWEAASAVPDATAFPSWPANYVWSSSSRPDSTASAAEVSFVTGAVALVAKTGAVFGCLVRAGVE